MGGHYVGAPVRRREDARFLTGDARFVDDIAPRGLCHLAFLRSPHAHARIRSVRTEAAVAMPGVVAVLGFRDLEPWMAPLPQFGAAPPALARAVRFELRHAAQYPLARRRVRYVGQAVAMVVADTRAGAEDALERLEVEWEILPAVIDAAEAERSAARLVHETWGDNVAVRFALTLGDPGRAFAEADLVVEERFTMGRGIGVPLEPRGIVAEWDARVEALTVWHSTQVPHFVQQGLAKALDLAPHKVRVVAPDVGGGFGSKGSGYAEDLLVPLVARRLRRPVKWIESRREHFMATTQARDQTHTIALAARRDGTLLAVRDRVLIDLGAYNVWGIVVPYNTAAHLLGPHRLRHLDVEVRGVVTHKTPNTPYRGAGRPEAAFAMDRALDCVARDLGMDPAEVRRRNYITAAEMPYDVGLTYRDGNALVYDSGDFSQLLEAALGRSEHEAFRREQATLRAAGVFRGVGLSGYVEGTAIGPFEGASVRLDQAGRVIVVTGAAASGQGHETVFAQVAADALGVPLDWVTVSGGDTGLIPFGVGTYGSRSAVTGGTSIVEACRAVREKLARAAAALLEAAPEDIEVDGGLVFVRGAPTRALTLADIVSASLPTFAAPGVASPDFEATRYAHVPTVTYASAVHVAQVEVDVETGRVRVLRYVVAHDCGTVINPIVVDGQIHGGVAQGIGGALFEELVHDEHGQILTGSLMEYAIPAATDLPSIEIVHFAWASPTNPLGAKGMGEGGAISPPAAIANAVDDALAPFGIRVTRAPLRPAALREALERARRAH